MAMALKRLILMLFLLVPSVLATEYAFDDSDYDDYFCIYNVSCLTGINSTFDNYDGNFSGTLSGTFIHELNETNHTGNLSSNRVVKDTGTNFLTELLDSILDKLFDRDVQLNDSIHNETAFRVSNDTEIRQNITDLKINVESRGNWTDDRVNVAFINQSNTFQENQTINASLNITQFLILNGDTIVAFADIGNLSDFGINWSQIWDTSFPAPCSSGYAINQLNHSVTCIDSWWNIDGQTGITGDYKGNFTINTSQNITSKCLTLSDGTKFCDSYSAGLFENSTGVIKAKSPQDINMQEKSINNASNITVIDRIFYGDENHFTINDYEFIDTISGESIDTVHTEFHPEGEILTCTIYAPNNNLTDLRLIECTQVGRNHSYSLRGNSQFMIRNDICNANARFNNGTACNMSAVSDYTILCDVFNKSCVYFADTAGRDPLLGTTGDLEIWGAANIMKGLRVTGFANFILGGDDVNALNGSFHSQIPTLCQFGASIGQEVEGIDETFVGSLGLFQNLQVDIGNWMVVSDALCDDGQCANAHGISGSGNINMEANFTTLNINATHLSFVYSLVNMLGTNSFTVTMNNNSGSGDVVIFTDSTDNVDKSSQTIALPDDFINVSKVSLNFDCDATQTNRECFVDTVIVNGTSLADTTFNETRIASQICYDTGSKDASGRCEFGEYWEPCNRTLIRRGNVTEILIASQTISGDLTVGGDIILRGNQVNNTAELDTRYLQTANGSLWNKTGNNLYPADINDNVGIGTTTPSSKLHIIGTINSTTGVFDNITSPEIYDSTPALSVDIDNRILYDSSKAPIIDWENKILLDSSSDWSIHFENRGLWASGGMDEILDFSTVGVADFQDTNIITTGDAEANSFNGSWNGSVNYALTTDIDTWISTNKTDTETILRNNIDTNITVLENRDDAINTTVNIIGLVGPHTNRTDADINTTVDEPRIVRTDWTNVTYDAELDNGSIVRSHNTSWVNDTVDEPRIVRTDWTNVTYDAELDNGSIVRSHNISWVTNLFSSGDGNITYSNGVFTLIRLSLSQFNNDLNWITNAVSDLVNYPLASSLPNVTMQQINDSFGNWSQAESSYVPYTGATQSVDLGDNDLLSTRNISAKGFVAGEDGIKLKDGGTPFFWHIVTPPTQIFVDKTFTLNLGTSDNSLTITGDPILGDCVCDQDVSIGADGVELGDTKVDGTLNVTDSFYASGTVGNDTYRYTWAELNSTYTDDDSAYLINGTDAVFNVLNVTDTLIISHINRNTSQDVKFYEDLNIDNANNGQKVYFYRNAPESNHWLEFYVDQFGLPVIQSGHQAGGYIYLKDDHGSTKLVTRTDAIEFRQNTWLRGDGNGVSYTHAFGVGNDAGIYWDGTNLIFLTNRTTPFTGIAYFTNNISYMYAIQRGTTDKEYDGNYLDRLKSPEEIHDTNTGKLNREEMFVGEAVTISVRDESNCWNVTEIDEVNGEKMTNTECGTKQEEGVNPGQISETNRRLISELKQENQMLKDTICKYYPEDEICKSA